MVLAALNGSDFVFWSMTQASRIVVGKGKEKGKSSPCKRFVGEPQTKQVKGVDISQGPFSRAPNTLSQTIPPGQALLQC